MKQTEETKVKMKVYIAGKIRGDKNYKAKFEEAEAYLKALGHSVMNPAVLPSSGFRHEEYMKICLAMLDVCEAVYMLPDWRKSKGARTEYKFASKKGKAIMFADDGGTKDKLRKEQEIEITGIQPIKTTGAVPAEGLFKVVFEYREAGQVKDPEGPKDD